MSNSVLAKMAVQISANNAQFNTAIKQSQQQMSAFQSAVVSFNKTLGAFGVALGAYEVLRGFQFTIKTIGDFEKQMSTVTAITGATGEAFKALENDALRLGRTTKFTATQVAELQVAYGRLGFSTSEILDATEATLSLAAATGEDLAKSADVAGSTVRGFELQASETMRVVDVMASSFNKTALSLENFTESMKYVAPVGNAAGATVEEVTAMLGVLADSGIRGSMAGTSLRKIFTDMTKDGRPLMERLQELADRGITLSDSFDEVGRTAQTSLLILSKNTDKIARLTNEFQGASGEANKMAKIIEDNLWGDVTQLTSAIEGLILSFKESSGPMREFVQALTAVVRWLSEDEIVEFFKWSAEVLTQIPRNWIQLAKAMAESNDEGERMNAWLKEMNEQAILDAFGDPNKIFASEAWNPFGSMFDQEKINAAAAALRKYRQQYNNLLKAVQFNQPKVKRGNSDEGEEFWHREIDMNPLSGLLSDDEINGPVAGIVKEIEYNQELADSLANLNKLREEQLDKMHATAEMAVTMGEAIGEAFSAMIKGEQNFAQVLAKITEQIITLYLQQSIAAMIKSAIEDKTTNAFPFAKIAVAAAGIGAVKALFGQIGSVSGGGSGNSLAGRTPSQMKLEVNGRIRGYDIALNQDKEGYRRSRVG